MASKALCLEDPCFTVLFLKCSQELKLISGVNVIHLLNIVEMTLSKVAFACTWNKFYQEVLASWCKGGNYLETRKFGEHQTVSNAIDSCKRSSLIATYTVPLDASENIAFLWTFNPIINIMQLKYSLGFRLYTIRQVSPAKIFIANDWIYYTVNPH